MTHIAFHPISPLSPCWRMPHGFRQTLFPAIVANTSKSLHLRVIVVVLLISPWLCSFLMASSFVTIFVSTFGKRLIVAPISLVLSASSSPFIVMPPIFLPWLLGWLTNFQCDASHFCSCSKYLQISSLESYCCRSSDLSLVVQFLDGFFFCHHFCINVW